MIGDKNLRSVAVIALSSFIYISLGANLTFGQKSSRQVPRKSSCQAGNLTFTCPANFKLVPLESARKLALLFQNKYHLGLFVAAPESGFEEQKFISDVTKTALDKFFPKESQSFAWQAINFSDSISKYEVGGGMVKGFNGNLFVLIKYRHLKIGGKDLFVGYVAEITRGGEAREYFEQSGYVESMPGCNASVKVIYSVTKEKIDEGNPPCTLVTPNPAG